MRLRLRLGGCQLACLTVAVLCIALSRVSPLPHVLKKPQKDVIDMRAAVESSKDPGSWALKRQEEVQEEDQSWEQVSRAQRAGADPRSLLPISQETVYFQGGGDELDGGRMSGALTSIAGGLQSVNREKGGFGFRFGRKLEDGMKKRRRQSQGPERKIAGS